VNNLTTGRTWETLWSLTTVPPLEFTPVIADHISRVTGRCFHCPMQLRIISRILTTDTIITLVNVVVVSQIGYCNAVLAGVYDVYLRQLQRVLNAAARLIVRKWKYDSVSATSRDPLHWLPFRQLVEFRLSVLVFNCLHKLAPSYLSTTCQPVAGNAGRRHRRSMTLLFQPQGRSDTVLAASPWQDCPPGILFQHCYAADN